MIGLFVVRVAACVLVSTTARADELGRTVLAKGLFSYQAPPGWTVSDLNVSFPVSRGPVQEGFVPNIHVTVAENGQSLSDFVEANIRASRRLPDFRLVNRSLFITAAGLEGTRVTVMSRVASSTLGQVFYFFEGGDNHKIIVCAACSAKDLPRQAPLLDASLRTFSLE